MLSNSDKAVNFTALILIIYLILYGYMSDTATIYAAFISVGGAVLASIGTVYLTKRKEKQEKRERIINTKNGLKIILDNIFLKVINLEIEHYKAYLSHLENNVFYPNINDRGILRSNVFNSFPEQFVLEMCLYYDLPYDRFYGTINTYYQLNDVSLSKVDDHFNSQLIEVKNAYNLEFLIRNGSFNTHRSVSQIITNQIKAVRAIIIAFETYKSDTEFLILQLESK